jgi:helix-turn-helix protein
MSSQPSISRSVNLGQRASDLKSVEAIGAIPAPEMTRKPMAREDRKAEVFAIAARGAIEAMSISVSKMLTTKEAAVVLGRPHSTLERWRCEGKGPDYVKEEGGVRYHEEHLREYIRRNTRTSSVRALVETKRESL